jgi:tRNA (cmo5U34)-methyltransferase
MKTSELIQSTATDSDLERLKLLPCAVEYFDTLLRQITLEPDQEFSMVHLGSGDGFLAHMMLKRFPHAQATLIDRDEKCLELSRKRLSAFVDQVTWLHQDFARIDPPGKHELIVAMQSVHHLNDIDKRALYRTLYSRVRPGGGLLIGDRIQQPTEHLRERYRRFWREDCLAAGADESAVDASLSRMWDDHDAEIEYQIEWIRNSGFRNVDLYYKYQMFAVFGGNRPDF